MIELRQYQQDAVSAFYQHLTDKPTNPCIVIPTGGGKTPVIATICKDVAGAWGGKVVILAHVKELLQQSAHKLQDICPEIPFGVYSAGLNRRDLHYPITVAGIQSIYKRAPMLGKVDLILVDEAHLIPPDGEGMYQTFLNEMRALNPQLRIGGLTATPYRTSTGNICTDDGILNEICYEIGVKELINKGYLSRLKTKGSKIKVDLSKVHTRGGEYVADELETAMAESDVVQAAVDELVLLADKRKSVLIFSCGVDHAREIVGRLSIDHCIPCGLITGETPADERAETLARFKAGELKYLCNINVLTTGFDAPNIDCVAMLRPTLSPGLYYQMAGRGFRIHPGKDYCLILDYGENVPRHGPVDMILPTPRPLDSGGGSVTKQCPECQEIIAGGYGMCPDCGYVFPEKESYRRAGGTAGTKGILSGDVSEEQLKVTGINYSVHLKKGADPATAPRSMRVTYRCGFNRWVSEWVCLEHDGFARKKALAWWSKHSNLPAPRTADEAVRIASLGGVGKPSEIVVAITAGDDFERVTEHLGVAIPDPESIDLAGEICPLCYIAMGFHLKPGRGPHAGRKECAECGTFIKWVSKAEMREVGDETEDDSDVIDDETVIIDDDFDPFKDCPF